MDVYILNEHWSAALAVKQILLNAHELMHNPNINDPAQKDAYLCCLNDKATFDQKEIRLVQCRLNELSSSPSLPLGDGL